VEYEILGMFSTVIVGIRYYTGRVGVNEVRKLVVRAQQQMMQQQYDMAGGNMSYDQQWQ